MTPKERKERCIWLLEEVVRLLESKSYDEVKQYIEFSGAGDGYGDENSYIDFRRISEGFIDDIQDLVDYCEAKGV